MENLKKEEIDPFNWKLKQTLTPSDLERYGSKFISDVANSETKDLFIIADYLEKNGRGSFVAEIEHRKAHPNSIGGFHLSAITALDIIHYSLRKNCQELLSGFKLINSNINCKKIVRSLKPNFIIRIQVIDNSNILISFEVENQSFLGSLKFSKTVSSNTAPTYELDQPNRNSFTIRNAEISNKIIKSSISFKSFYRSTNDFTLGPGLIVAMISQLSIVHLYAASEARSKKNGVVMVSCKINHNQETGCSGLLSLTLNIQNIRQSSTLKGHTIAEISFQCMQGNISGNMTFIFEPF